MKVKEAHIEICQKLVLLVTCTFYVEGLYTFAAKLVHI